MIVVRIVVGVVGAVVVMGVLGSAVRTVVVPRGEQVMITRAVLLTVRRMFRSLAGRRERWEDREAVLARFAAVALVSLPLVWATGVVGGFTAIFWALDVSPVRDAVVLSGSSFTTLGFRATSDLPSVAAAVTEALIGLGLVALLISFLPTIYSAFSRREVTVAKLHLRATDPAGVASPTTLIIRASRIGGLEQLTELWREWEDWFVEIEETHTSFPMLVYFRSPARERSWITGAGLALDAAGLFMSTVESDEDRPRAALMVRTGTLALRRVADFFDFGYDPSPDPTDQISIERQEFDAVYDQLSAAGVPVKADRDRCWRDFAGWRVNYDTPLLAISAHVDAPPAKWASDRSTPHRRPTILPRSRDRRS